MTTRIAWITTLLTVGTAGSALAQQTQAPAQPRTTRPAATPNVPPATAADMPARGGARVVAAPAAKADPATEKTAIALKQEMDQILTAWEKRSSQVKSLSVEFKRIDESAAWGKEEFTGQAILQSPDLAVLHFKKRTNPEAAKDAPKYEDDERIVSNGTEVLQYKWEDKKLYVYPLDAQVQQKSLQQGPLPFLFNMKAAETRKRYDMALTQQSDKQYMIRIAPLLDIDRESFSKAFLLLNKTTFLPDRLRLVATNEKDYQDFTFSQVVANQPIDPKVFRKVMMPGWSEIVNDGKEAVAAAPAPGSGPGRAAPAAGRAAPGRGATQPPRPSQAASRNNAAAPPR